MAEVTSSSLVGSTPSAASHGSVWRRQTFDAEREGVSTDRGCSAGLYKAGGDMAHEDNSKRPIVDPVAVIATGLASAGAAFLTSRFGIAGTVLGTAITVMIITAGSSILEVYLRSAKDGVSLLPESLRERIGAPRPVLAGTLTTALVASMIGMGVVTGVELGAGKSLSCWLWDRCPAAVEDRAAGGGGTRPTVLGGGPAQIPSPEDLPYGRSEEQTPASAPDSAPETGEVSGHRLILPLSPTEENGTGPTSLIPASSPADGPSGAAESPVPEAAPMPPGADSSSTLSRKGSGSTPSEGATQGRNAVEPASTGQPARQSSGSS